MSTCPPGFRLAGVHCGLKKKPGKEDLTLLVADRDAVAAAVYTTNRVVAAPVVLDRQRTPTGRFRALVVNSGNANACTGDRGMDDARRMTQLAAAACGAADEQALVMSTGIIGHFLPMEKIEAGIRSATGQLGTDRRAFEAAARGILTTDNGIKIGERSVGLAAGNVTLSGMCKGAGMIGPKMATMLGVILTDARLTVDDAQRMISSAADQSFNCVSVEGHMSTNDTLLLVASGAASDEPLSGDDARQFEGELTELCIELAKMLPDDGEGATHLIEIEVTGCGSVADARRIAETIASSALVKTAITGCDPNWGRIVSAAGYAGVAFDAAKVDLHLNGHLIYHQGAPAAFDAAEVSASMKRDRNVFLKLSLAEGNAAARHWTSDLTVGYVTFNSDYTT